MKRFLLVLCMFLGGAGLGVYLFTTPGCACESVFPERIYSLYALNPARDRAPERVADKFLRDQSKGKCEPAGSDLCKYALQIPLSDWRLEAREDDRARVGLYYYVHLKGDRSDEPRAEAAVWVDFNEDHWQVSGFQVPR